MGLTINKKDKIMEKTVKGRERAANVAMDSFKKLHSKMGGFGEKKEYFIFALAQMTQESKVESLNSIP